MKTMLGCAGRGGRAAALRGQPERQAARERASEYLPARNGVTAVVSDTRTLARLHRFPLPWRTGNTPARLWSYMNCYSQKYEHAFSL